MRVILGILSVMLLGCVTTKADTPPALCTDVVNGFIESIKPPEVYDMKPGAGFVMFGAVNQESGTVRVMVVVIDKEITAEIKSTATNLNYQGVCRLPAGSPTVDASVFTGEMKLVN